MTLKQIASKQVSKAKDGIEHVKDAAARLRSNALEKRDQRIDDLLEHPPGST